MKYLFALLFFSLLSSPAGAQQTQPLYTGPVPNSRDVPDPETITDREVGGRAIENVAVPELTAYVPEHPNGRAVIICPGGGYARLAYDKEGVWVAERLMRDSITCFVLKYRIPQDATNVDRSLAPLMDAQQAIRTVRAGAADYAISPDKIGIMGFSAGGHLAATAATHFARPADPTATLSISLRPDFVALLYPVITMDSAQTHTGSRNNLIGEQPSESEILRFSADKQVTNDSPPAVLVHAADDGAVPVGNSLAYYEACVAHAVPAEMHLYAHGGHGFGLKNPTTPDDWVERLLNWMRTL